MISKETKCVVTNYNKERSFAFNNYYNYVNIKLTIFIGCSFSDNCNKLFCMILFEIIKELYHLIIINLQITQKEHNLVSEKIENEIVLTTIEERKNFSLD